MVRPLMDSCQKYKFIMVDLWHSVFSIRFLCSCTGICAWITINMFISDYSLESIRELGGVYYLETILGASDNVGPIILVIGTVPYTYRYLYEKNSGFLYSVVSRIGVQKYGVGKVVAVSTSSFLSPIISVLLLRILFFLLKIPSLSSYDNFQYVGYTQIAILSRPSAYYAVRSIVLGLACSIASMFSLNITVSIPNSYVACLSPLIGYYLADCFISLFYNYWPNMIIWRMISPNLLFWSQPFFTLNLLSFAWTTILLTTMIVWLSLNFIHTTIEEKNR